MRDTPTVVRRVERDLSLVLDTVRRGDPALRSLVLTGGFARGEGQVLDGEPQNDYDLVALRGVGRTRTPYATMRSRLEERLGLHIDLAPVPAWRLPHVSRSIFWYETALRGRVLWGEDLLGRVPVRSPRDLDRDEALRLLSNRAAGLLLGIGKTPHERRIQAAKGLLAAMDTHLLSCGEFAPSQSERWQTFRRLRPQAAARASWFGWAYAFKTGPARAPARDADEAWEAAARAVLAAVPVALRLADAASLAEAARHDGLVDHVVYGLRAGGVAGARRLAWHPTARVRVASLRLLRASLEGRLDQQETSEALRGLLRRGGLREPPLRILEGLRGATLQ